MDDEVLYRCEACGGTFLSDVSDEQADAEAVLMFGALPREELMVVCDPCFQRVSEQGYVPNPN